jgi:hypothetical protein
MLRFEAKVIVRPSPGGNLKARYAVTISPSRPSTSGSCGICTRDRSRSGRGGRFGGRYAGSSAVVPLRPRGGALHRFRIVIEVYKCSRRVGLPSQPGQRSRFSLRANRKDILSKSTDFSADAFALSKNREVDFDAKPPACFY